MVEKESPWLSSSLLRAHVVQAWFTLSRPPRMVRDAHELPKEIGDERQDHPTIQQRGAVRSER